MEIKMCRFQRSDYFEWLQLVLEVAHSQAHLSMKYTTDESQGRWSNSHSMKFDDWTEHHLIYCYYTTAKIQVQKE